MTASRNIRAHAFNAVGPMLAEHGRWLPLSVRQAIAEAVVAAAEPVIRADERARIRSLLPYNVNCCDGFSAAVAGLIGEHGDA